MFFSVKNSLFHKRKNIPKIVHYVWVGDKNINDTSFKDFFKGWKKNLKGYKFMFWNEKAIRNKWDNEYLNNAFDNKKWSNVSNLVRLLSLKEYGGIYMDTDIEVIDNFNEMMSKQCFLGFQLKKHRTHWVNGAVIGSVPNHWFIDDCIKFLLEKYNGFESSDLSGPVVVTHVLKEMGLIKYSTSGVLIKDVFIYPVEVFYPYSWREKFTKSCVKANTVAIHHWNKGW